MQVTQVMDDHDLGHETHFKKKQIAVTIGPTNCGYYGISLWDITSMIWDGLSVFENWEYPGGLQS